MTQVGRLLRILRQAAGMSREQAAIALECGPRRIRDLETGGASLEYLEGLRLAKAYLLCPQCFRRQFESAIDRELVRSDREAAAALALVADRLQPLDADSETS